MLQNDQTRFNFQIDFCQKWEKCKAWLRRNTEQYLEGGSTDQNRKGLRESLFSTVPLLKRFHIHGGALEITSILQLPRFWRCYPSTNPPCPHNRIYTKWLAQGIDKYLKYLNRNLHKRNIFKGRLYWWFSKIRFCRHNPEAEEFSQGWS